MLVLIKKLIRYSLYQFSRFSNIIRRISLFYIPNKLKLFPTKYILKGKFPSIQQKTLITGKGKVYIGNKCSFGYKPGGFNYCGSIELQPRYSNSMIEIGDNVATNNNISIISANKITIGQDTLIGQNVTIMDFEAHGISPSERRNIGEIGKVSIGENVWLGNSVIILKNTIIGKNSIVAAGAVVSGVFPENVIIGGVPAKIIKQING